MDEQIEADDVTTDRIVLFDLKQPYITNPADVIGKAAIRPLAAQSAIRITAVRRPFAVHKGDRVMIEARQGNLSIQTVGVTKSHGEMGQTITVSNVDSGKELRATVVAPGVVTCHVLTLLIPRADLSDADPASCCSVCSLPAPHRRAQNSKKWKWQNFLPRKQRDRFGRRKMGAPICMKIFVRCASETSSPSRS